MVNEETYNDERRRKVLSNSLHLDKRRMPSNSKYTHTSQQQRLGLDEPKVVRATLNLADSSDDEEEQYFKPHHSFTHNTKPYTQKNVIHKTQQARKSYEPNRSPVLQTTSVTPRSHSKRHASAFTRSPDTFKSNDLGDDTVEAFYPSPTTNYFNSNFVSGNSNHRRA